VTVRTLVSTDLSVTVTVEGGGQYWLEHEIRVSQRGLVDHRVDSVGRGDLLCVTLVNDDRCLITTPIIVVSPLEKTKTGSISKNSTTSGPLIFQAGF
jgi:hypothetical protein